MHSSLKTVVVNGSLHRPSRTQVLLEAVHQRLAEKIGLNTVFIQMADLLPDLGAALSVDSMSPAGRHVVRTIEDADFLIVGTPVFRASMPGLFKHLFDLIDMEALVAKPVLLAATGGSPRHSLVIDHQLRPLFAFFQSLTLPIGVYATPEDLPHGNVIGSALAQRLDLVAELALPVLQGRMALREEQPGAMAR